jgi:hypothetical protein
LSPFTVCRRRLDTAALIADVVTQAITLRCPARRAQDGRAEPQYSPWPMQAWRASASSAPSVVR